MRSAHGQPGMKRSHRHKMHGYASEKKGALELVKALTARLREAYRTNNQNHSRTLEADIRRTAPRAQAERILKKLHREFSNARSTEYASG